MPLGAVGADFVVAEAKIDQDGMGVRANNKAVEAEKYFQAPGVDMEWTEAVTRSAQTGQAVSLPL